MYERVTSYFDNLGMLARKTVITGHSGQVIPLGAGIEWLINTARQTHDAGNKLMFIGNGGSAAIASHMATDFSKNGNIRSLAFNDSSALTCLSNDLGYENVFATQLALHARPGDLLIAISSSGRSKNILNAVDVARHKECAVFTLSGFSPSNPLRRQGNFNLYVPSNEYGFVEVMHLAMCHAVLDFAISSHGRPAVAARAVLCRA